MHHENLPVAIWAGTDTDGGDFQRFGDLTRQIERNAFEHNGKSARLLDSTRILEHLCPAGSIAPLNFMTTHSIYGLGRQPNVTHNRNLGTDQSGDRARHFFSAFQLHRLGTRLNQTTRVTHSLLFRDVVRQVGHIAQDQRAWFGASDHLRVIGHLVHRDRDCRISPLHDHAEAVPDKKNVDTRSINQPSERAIISGHHGQVSGEALGALNSRNGNFLIHRI